MSDFYCISCFKYYPLSERIPHGSYSVCVDCDCDNNFIDTDEVDYTPKLKPVKFTEKHIDYFIDRYGDK